ncbi:SAV_2336 N-terminal domain-related protein [Micromonospora cathayae]|uniref:SAV_2336 N-terminal domain-related protein n=1 Tax=Micromonospora cathayae TaxID=3028804 RepID=A0ABY7ZWW4_9ACTN|nr:SAV_2336 N-terminal domain-related protein [Micromonospora sp. HUAS 3]WDZ87490.1 SAV_2336 N-terminal domain-related protein [Micromonospora sp. HUAS 3]
MDVARLVAVLDAAGLESTPREIAEALWLARYARPPSGDRRVPEPAYADLDLDVDPDLDADLDLDVDLDDGSADADPAARRPGGVPAGRFALPRAANRRRREAPPHAPTATAPKRDVFPARPETAPATGRAPLPAALSQAAAVQRALRPFKRRVPSQRRSELDEEATAHAIAQTGVWTPVLRPVTERWLDLVLVVDTSAAMAVWRGVVTDFRETVEQIGAFRRVETWYLDTGTGECTIGRTPHGPRQPAGRLLDAGSRRAYLVITDAAGQAWYAGTAATVLTRLAERGPTAVVQPLPARFWRRTGLPPQPGRVRAAQPAVPNTRLSFSGQHDLLDEAGPPVPVLALDPAWLGAWAQLVTAPPADGVVLPVALPAAGTGDQPAAVPPPAPSPPRAADRVRVFHQASSLGARTLAVALSLVPLTLPVMRLVQHLTVPWVPPSVLAEVLLGGLVRQVAQDRYEFLPGVREELLHEVRGSQALDVIGEVSRYFAARAGGPGATFPVVDSPPDAATDPLAWVPPLVAERMGLRVPRPDRANRDDGFPAEVRGYELVLRVPGAPPAPAGVRTVELRLADGAESPEGAVGALRASGLSAADFVARVVLFAGEVRETLIHYAALYGFAGRRVDAYAERRLLRLSQPDPEYDDFPDAGRPDGYLEWGQAGGPPAAAVPTVSLDLRDPRNVTVIRYAARLRLVPPPTPRAALQALVRVAAIRRRDRGERLPFLSTGREPAPVGKEDPAQGVDLERVRRAGQNHRQELRRADHIVDDLLPPRPRPPWLRRMAEANAVDIRTVLARLGSEPDETGKWRCPIGPAHDGPAHDGPAHDGPAHDGAATVRVSGDNRARCARCQAEKVGPVRLVVEARGIAPDEAVSVVLGEEHHLEVGSTVTATVTRVGPTWVFCTVQDAGTERAARLKRPARARRPGGPDRSGWAPGDTVVALVTGVLPAPDRGLLLDADSAELVERVLPAFVEELCTGRVVIADAARVAGARTKVAVAATARGVDAKGAVVGRQASRVQGLGRLLGRPGADEHFQIIQFAQDREKYLVNALSPARATDVLIGDGHAVAAVPHGSGGGIGRGGLNAELAGKLTGLRVHIVTDGSDLSTVLAALTGNAAGRAAPGHAGS